MHGTIGGITSVLQGGKFGHGFASAGFAAAATFFNNSNYIHKNSNGFSWRRVAIGAAIGGTASKLSSGKFANGAANAAFAQLFSPTGGSDRQDGSNSAGQSGGRNPLSVVGDVIGKIWALPNTIIGAVYGGVGHIVGEIGYALGFYDVSPSISFGNNAIQFLDNPFTIRNTAITLGNTISYGRGVSPSQYGSYGDSSVQIGRHEAAHTYQYQTLGPLFLPAYFISGGISGPAGNPFENAAQEYGRGTGGWWPK